jgi:hypothetical protein
MKILPDQSRLIELFDYNPATGDLRWRRRTDIALEADRVRWNTKYAGKIAGCLNKRGYRVVTLDGVTYYAHRIIWKLIYGVEPSQLLDHEDTIKDHNWLSNLREATSEQNAQNRKRMRNKPSDLPKGVTRTNSGKYQVYVKKGNYLGCYDTIEEAQRLYAEKSRELFGKYARVA